MNSPVLSLPGKKDSAWIVETRPKEAEAWLASLPMADASGTAKQIFQALVSLNRLEVDVRDRLAVMELYRAPVAHVCDALQVNFAHLALPLGEKQRQLAEFLRQLQIEMAYGYKHVIADLLASRSPWTKRGVAAMAIERSIHYLGEVLLRSYAVYMPYPPGTWREIHELYRIAEEGNQHLEPIPDARPLVNELSTIQRSYLRVVLLGIAGPYQLPQMECLQVNQYLYNWVDKTILDRSLDIPTPIGHFLIDLSSDLPAMLFPRDVKLKDAPHLRVLNAIELARVVHLQINKLQQGESARQINLGADCIDAACLDMLRRLIRFWGRAARRQYTRRSAANRSLSICEGVNAIHFFSSGSHPFVPPQDPEGMTVVPATPPAADAAIIDFDVAVAEHTSAPSGNAPDELFRVDQWQIRDQSAGGMSLVRSDADGTHVRVGDVLGIEDPETDQWRVGIARWLKSPDSGELEIGVEMIAPKVTPVALRPVSATTPYVQALLLPAIPALRQPPSLVMERDTVAIGHDLWLKDSDDAPRRVRVLRLLERTGSFDQVLFADVRRSG